MSTSRAAAAHLGSLTDERTSPSTVPWSIYAVLFASTSVILGVMWDISWHRSIGRDTFWTPAHLAIYLGGIVSGLTCGYVALKTTFAGTADERGSSVRFWGFRAPLGAWVCIWGAFAMVTSAPFDDWWHNAYGLDVKIVSPPHIVLALGIAAIQCGAMLMALAWQNRAKGDRRVLGRLYLLGAGLLLLLAATVGLEYTQRWDMHQSNFWQVSAAVFTFFIISGARASVAKWPATAIALVYTVITQIMVLVLPLFAAQPLLGPIYVQVDRFVPPDFPLLLIVPAFFIDLVMQRAKRRGMSNDWVMAAAIAVVFLLAFVAAQWPFADFLMTPWARNAFFVSNRMDYGVPPEVQARFYVINAPDDIVRGLSIALVLAFLSARAGLWLGNWMAL